MIYDFKLSISYFGDWHKLLIIYSYLRFFKDIKCIKLKNKDKLIQFFLILLNMFFIQKSILKNNNTR